MNRIALVTGASGFIGRTLCADLVRQGWRVRAMVRCSGRLPEMTGVTATETGDLAAETPGSSNARWFELLTGVDTVFHLAALVHQSGLEDQDARYRVLNVDLPLQLGRAAVEAKVRRFVFLSSIKAVGETSGAAPLTPASEPRPVDAYGRSKLSAEKGLQTIVSGSDTSLTIVRPPLVYGPGARANLALLIKLVSLGMPLPLAGIDNRRSLISRSNLSDLLVRVASADIAAGRVLMPGDGDWSTPALLTRLAQGLKVAPRLFHAPPWVLTGLASLVRQRARLSRLTDSLHIHDPWLADIAGWAPPQDASHCLQEMIDAYQNGSS